MIQRSAILLEHVSCFSYCLLIIKLYWGVKWITIKKKCLLVQVQIHRYSWKLPFPWPQGNIAGFYQLPSVSAKTLNPHPALPCAAAKHLFRATCHCSLHTDKWREHCWNSAWKWAQISAEVAACSTNVLVSSLTFLCPWDSRIKILLWKATTIDIIVIRQ